jgi:hypothetical protein
VASSPTVHAAFAPKLKARPPVLALSRLARRSPCFGPATRHRPIDGVVDGLQLIRFPSWLPSSYRAQALTPVGLPPIERNSLSWSHSLMSICTVLTSSQLASLDIVRLLRRKYTSVAVSADSSVRVRRVRRNRRTTASRARNEPACAADVHNHIEQRSGVYLAQPSLARALASSRESGYYDPSANERMLLHTDRGVFSVGLEGTFFIGWKRDDGSVDMSSERARPKNPCVEAGEVILEFADPPNGYPEGCYRMPSGEIHCECW